MGYASIMKWNRSLAGFAALNGAAAVALGAFAAHGAAPQLKNLLSTGASYQLIHAVFGFACAVWPDGPRLAGMAGWLATAGGLIFSLALAIIGLASLTAFGAVAPIGGVMMIAAWLIVAWAAFKPTPSDS